MPRSEMVGVVLAAMILAVCMIVIPSLAGGLPVDWTSVVVGAVVVAIIAGVVGAVLCWATRRRAGAT